MFVRLSKDIMRIARSYKIKITFRIRRTLQQTIVLMKVKDRLLDTHKSHVVYRIPCDSFEKVYTREM